jgi:hypothetical protein
MALLLATLMLGAGCSDNEAHVTIQNRGCYPVWACVDYTCRFIDDGFESTWIVKWDRESLFSRGTRGIYIYAHDEDTPRFYEAAIVTVEHDDHIFWPTGWCKVPNPGENGEAILKPIEKEVPLKEQFLKMVQ